LKRVFYETKQEKKKLVEKIIKKYFFSKKKLSKEISKKNLQKKNFFPTKMVKFITTTTLLTTLTSAQVFLHSPRGSNNRLNEKTANNANPYRLFFANHNNDYNRRGGYNVGENQKDDIDNENQQYHMKYFMSGSEAGGDSWLTVEWTQLLGCGVDEDGDRIHNCEVVIQSMCQKDEHPESDKANQIRKVKNTYTIKNGMKTDTINYKWAKANNIIDPKGLCYIDAHDRDLHNVWDRIPAGQKSSIEWCKSNCKNKGYIYAGVQHFEHCFCGNEFGKHGISPDQAHCKDECRDQEKNICGGPWRNNVFLSGLIEPQANDIQEDRSGKIKRRDQNSNSENIGLHESWESFERCPYNDPSDSHYKRAGFECNHERENYPVNYGTQWTDVAYFTDDLNNCQAVQEAAREAKYECVEYYDAKKQHRIHKSDHKNEADCTNAKGDWLPFYQFKEYVPSITSESNCQGPDLIWGRALDFKAISEDKLTTPKCLRFPPKTECLQTPNSRQNYLGMADDGTNEAPRFQWALPIYEHNQRCVLRIRHIISNNDEDAVDSYNKDIRQGTGSSMYLALPQKHSSPFENKVVFQDRSHIFKLLKRPSTIPQDQTLHNIVVRGKRGNIVQTFPAVEYDFCPNKLEIENGDAVQFQWTGSNNHDNDGHSDGQAGDDGEGQGGTDRNNMIQLYYNKVNFPLPGENHTMFENAEFLWSSGPGSSDAANANADIDDLTPFQAALAHATSGYYWSAKDVEKINPKLDKRLNNANPSFQGVVFKPQANQKYYYVGMRNNNFSNRSQKGQLVIGEPVDDTENIKESLRRPRAVSECSKYE